MIKAFAFMMKPNFPLFQVPQLTPLRMALALLVALAIDGLQFFLGPFGWIFVDQGLDVVGMVLTNWILGFHFLLLPTFIVKLVPVLDELPTWTACVVAVIALRKREQAVAKSPPEIRGHIGVGGQPGEQTPPPPRA